MYGVEKYKERAKGFLEQKFREKTEQIKLATQKKVLCKLISLEKSSSKRREVTLNKDLDLAKVVTAISQPGLRRQSTTADIILQKAYTGRQSTL